MNCWNVDQLLKYLPTIRWMKSKQDPFSATWLWALNTVRFTYAKLLKEKKNYVIIKFVFGFTVHHNHVLHRDIKPSNLLMGDDGRLRIADFGVCNEFQGAEDAWLDNTVGTPAFLAPEALVGKFSGKAADIWSMGITLYAFVYGILPFFDMNIVALYGLIQHQGLKFPPNPTISAKLKDLLIRMLSKDPSQRITLPEIKSHSWVTCDGTQPLPAEEDNCSSGPFEITAEDLDQSVRSIPHLASLILVKAMLRKHSFHHPFKGTPFINIH